MIQDMKTILTKLFTELPLGKLPLGNFSISLRYKLVKCRK